MSDDAPSKRARQKQRREAKLAQQRRQEAAARRNRIVLFSVVGLVIAGLIAWQVVGILNRNRAAQEQAERVAQQLDELGCTEDTEQPDAGAGHLETAQAQLVANPPEALYQDRPATSGRHYPAWVRSGFYDARIDERVLVHNLEHGYVNIWYDEGASADDMAELEEFVTSSIDGDFQKIVAAPWGGELPDDQNFVFTAWGFRQSCEQFDPEVATVFARAHHSSAGDAPERTLPPHLEEGNGTIDPGGEALLFPPLGEDDVSEQVSEHPGSSEAPTDAP